MKNFSHMEFKQAIRKLAKMIPKHQIKYLYGVPRGGSIVAVYLSHRTGIPICNNDKNPNEILVVDDICDTGHTLQFYDDMLKATIFYKRTASIEPDYWVYETTEFIKFPWETETSAKVDYASR